MDGSDGAAIVGVLVRVEPTLYDRARRELDALDGVSLFDVNEPASIGALIEAADLDEAHAILRRDISTAEGVRAAWPVHVHYDPCDDAQAAARSTPGDPRSTR